MSTNTSKLNWWNLAKIEAVAKSAGVHVRSAWRENGGEYGLNLPAELRQALERVDWSRGTPEEVRASLDSLAGSASS